MVQWRDRGFVQDSDDEDEDLTQLDDLNGGLSHNKLEEEGEAFEDDTILTRGNGESVKATSRSDNGISPTSASDIPNVETVDDDETTVRYMRQKACVQPDTNKATNIRGLEVTSGTSLEENDSQDELSAQQPPLRKFEALKDIFDISSSEGSLSSHPEFDQVLTSSGRLSPVNSHPDRGTVVEVPVDDVPSGPDQPIPSLQGAQDGGRGRNFRQRNPIQLHPYLLEQEQYRQSLRARGLRPLALAPGQDSQAQLHNSGLENFSPDKDRPRSPLSSYNSSSELSMMLSPQLNVESSSLNLDSNTADRDFLDIDKVHNLSRPGKAQNGFKRRKTSQADRFRPSREPGLATPSLGSEFQTNTGELAAKLFPDSSDSDIPVLTPRTKTKPRKKRRFRFPQGFKSIKGGLPTPITSSEPRLSVREQMDMNSRSRSISPASAADADQTLPMFDSVPMEEQSDSSASVESETIRAAQKRSKGVLPASWFTLDKHLRNDTNRPRSRRKSPNHSPARQVHQRGIAQHIIKFTDPKLTHGVIEISDDSDTETAAFPTAPITSEVSSNSGLSRAMPYSAVRYLDEVEEDNSIDRMIPSTSRPRKKSSRNRKKQTKLPDVFEAAPTHGRTAAAVAATARRSISPHRTAKYRAITGRRGPKSKRKPPLLGVLDFAAQSKRSSPQPDFLRLAMRRVRARPDRGRQRPDRKLISFNNRTDNAEAVSVLEDWKSGRISVVQVASHPSEKTRSHRTPLVEASHNARQRKPSSPTWLEAAGLSSQATGPVNGPEHTKTYSHQPILKQSRLVMSPLLNDVKAPSPMQRKHVERGVRTAQVSRTGQLEDLQKHQDRRYPREAFKRRLSRLNHSLKNRINHDDARDDILTRFLEAGGPSSNLSEQALEISTVKSSKKIQKPPYRQRKRPAQRLRTEDPILYRTAHEPTDQLLDVSSQIRAPEVEPRAVVGLAAFGTHYSIDFNITKLPTGTFFHQSTFIGSGELQATLRLCQVDLDSYRGSMSINYGKETIRWGYWNEDVASQLEQIFEYIAQAQVTTVEHTSVLRSVVKYFNTTLSFSDAVDRSSFISRIIASIAVLHRTATGYDLSESTHNKHMIVELLMYLAIICTQTAQLSSHPNVSAHLMDNADQMLVQVSKSLLSEVFSFQSTTICDFITKLGLRKVREAGIRDDDAIIQATVVLWHLLCPESAKKPTHSFWELVNETLFIEIAKSLNDVTKLEDGWRRLFSIMPLLNFDSLGIAMSSTDDRGPFENWTLVKSLLLHTLRLHDGLNNSERSTINAYVRATLGRCLYLLQYWEWCRCESILYAVFDFFARRDLSFLEYEESRISPPFLETISANANDVRLEPGDASFHIFLKILLVGLSRLSSSYTYKKMRNIAWRFVPNHGRTYRKDENLRRDHLDALRNHHDLLTVLYAAVPPLARPQLNLVQRLVDYEASHSEVCLLNVRTWTNLVRFQLSTNEPLSALSPFGQWFNSTVESLLRQHRGARLEAEEFVNATRHSGIAAISQGILESTISKNQKQSESIIHTAITSLISVVTAAPDKEAGLTLFRHAGLKNLFCALDTKQDRINSVIGDAVDAYRSVLELSSPLTNEPGDDEREEDSQDYGEWPVEDDPMETDAASTKFGINNETIEPLAQLLSNCFGSENLFDEALLKKVVDAWVTVAHCAVKHKSHDWSYYLNPQSSGSWWQLRDTEQTRKFFPYYLSAILDCDKKSFVENRWTILSSWLICLVERDSKIKFQHLFTTKLLNIGFEEPILQNPPFLRTTSGTFYNISSDEFRSGRLGLISALLYNIRKAHDETFYVYGHDQLQLRQEYKSLVRQLMASMKKIFQEINAGSAVRGAYIEFVQNVVEFLQQYTSDICPIDKFFTDSSAFPLPAKDPLYIVGRLKSYGLKSSDEASLKKLAIFVQTVSERAAADNHQQYLTEQLKESTDGGFKSISSRPSLCQLLMEGIFPAYIEIAFTRPLGWLFAPPILDALVYIFDGLLLSCNLSNAISVSAALKATTSILTFIQNAMSCTNRTPGMLSRPQTLMILSKMTLTVASSLKSIDYLSRSSKQVDATIACIVWIRDFLDTLPLQLNNCDSDENAMLSVPRMSNPQSDVSWLRSFCVQELTETLSRSWSEERGNCYVLRGTSKKQIVVDVGLWEEEEASLQHAIRMFKSVLSQLPAFNESIEPARRTAASDLFV